MNLRAKPSFSSVSTRVSKRALSLLLTCGFAMSLLSACGGANGLLLLPRIEASQSASPAGSSENSIAAVGTDLSKRKKVQVLFFKASESISQQTSYTPLSTENLARLTFDGQFTLESGALQREAQLSQSFQFLELGAHVIELSFNDPPQDIKIPLEIPEGADDDLTLRVHLTFTAQGTVRDIKVGYDQNQDTVIDSNSSIFRSSDGQNYLRYLPDGQVKEWVSPPESSQLRSCEQRCH